LDIKKDGRKSEAMEAAGALLLEMLANGARPTTEIEASAAAKGIGEKSLKNAKKALFIRAERAGGRWYWYLPGQEPPL